VAGPIDLPAINVWLAFSVADHAHHQRARHYWYEEAGDQLAFCRVTALGFMRLSTNAFTMGGRPLTVQQAWRAYGAFSRLPEVLLVDEPQGCETWLERRWEPTRHPGNGPIPTWRHSQGRADCGSCPSMVDLPTLTASISFTWKCKRH
jgi:hypothetical protein